MAELFASLAPTPLAERLRPATIHDVLGQDHLLGAEGPLGRMLAESRNFLALSPWPAIFAGVAILFAALGFNLLGDGLRDALNPRT